MATILPPSDRTLLDQVVRLLRHQIILGNLPPGERLVEHRLSQQLEVSRSTIREALRRLEAESLIETTSHRGSWVASLDPNDAFEICELHALLESFAIRQSKLPVSDKSCARLQDIVDQMATLTFPQDADAFIDLDHEFHRTIVDGCGQRRTLQVWSGMSSLLSVLVALSIRCITIEGSVTAQRHQVIIDALCQPDHQVAEEAAGEHYRSLVAQLKQAVAMSQTEREQVT